MIKKDFFGTIGDKEIFYFTIENSHLIVKILNYGCVVQSIIVKEKNIDVVLGYKTIEDYITDKNYFGAVVGRTVNCIKNAELSFHGKKYLLSKNDGENHLHGGVDGLSKRIWDYKINQDELILTTKCLDLEDGYCGNLQVEVVYALNENSLCVKYSAVCDEDTPFNITNHSYFNLNGAGKVFDHYFKFQCLDKNHQLNNCKLLDKEYDENIFISGHGYREISRVYSECSNIELTVLSDMPCVQFYTANELDKVVGKKVYNRNEGFCIETQFAPQDVMCEKVFLKKNKKINKVTSFVFKLIDK